jgi:hypothetical protein
MPSHWLNLVNINGIERLAWRQENPRRRVYKCWQERNWLGNLYTVCDWVLEPPTYTIVDNSQRPLPDGDAIRLRVSDATPGSVAVVMSVYYQVTWWKALRVTSYQPSRTTEYEVYGSGSIAPLEPDDRVQTPPIVLQTADIHQGIQLYPSAQGGAIELGKAKFLGWHHWMYGIPLKDLIRFDGKRLQFHWIGD